MTFTKTYYLVKVVGQDQYLPRKDSENIGECTLEQAMSKDISKWWFSKKEYAQSRVTLRTNPRGAYRDDLDPLEIVPITVKLEIDV